MIRLTYLLRRNRGLTTQEFHTHWRDIHGPAVAGMARRMKLLRYVQVHTLHEESRAQNGPRGTMEEPYDGVEEMWWETPEDLHAGAAALDSLVDPEAEFIDHAASPFWFGHEYPQINPSPEVIVASPMSSLVKFYYPMRPAPGLSADEARRYWLTNHGPLIRRTGTVGHLPRYIQVHRCEEALELDMRRARGTVEDVYMGHAELWFDRTVRDAGSDSPERAKARDLAFADESRFIDFKRSAMWVGKEEVFVDRWADVP